METVSANTEMYHDIRQFGEGITLWTKMMTNAAKCMSSLHAKNGLIDVGDRNRLRYKLFIQPGKEKLLLNILWLFPSALPQG